MTASSTIKERVRHIPPEVWTLGFVSMLMDISSEMIHALLPVYMITVLGISTLSVGIIEGIAEATAAITKIFSGAMSDWLGKRKGLATLGYAMAACAKPVFPLAPSLSWLIAARFIDRVGKGIRGAPRDALVADLAPPEARGTSFGLRQSLDTALPASSIRVGDVVQFVEDTRSWRVGSNPEHVGMRDALKEAQDKFFDVLNERTIADLSAQVSTFSHEGASAVRQAGPHRSSSGRSHSYSARSAKLVMAGRP